MDLLIYLLVTTVRIFLTVEEFLFLARAITSWLFMADDGIIPNFLYAVTEPLILPARAVLNRFESVQNLPIDIPFMVTIILMSVLQIMLPTVYI